MKLSKNNLRKNVIKSRNGFSLVEVMIASTIIMMVILGIGMLTQLMATGAALKERRRAAENQASALLSKLKAQQGTFLQDGGAFTVDETGQAVRNSEDKIPYTCTASFCDKVYVIPTNDGTTPEETVTGWNDTLPQNAELKFIRAWSVSDEDTSRNWKRITIAVFPENSLYPITTSVTGGVIK